jgi:arsenate reductase
VEIWFNPSCSKCRVAVEALDAAGASYSVRRYLDDPPTEAEIEEALAALGLDPWDITRTKEPLAEELGVGDLPHDRARWVRLLVENPSLIQRPILLASDGTAYVGRTAEAVQEALEHDR